MPVNTVRKIISMLLFLLLGIACGAQTDSTEIKLLRYKEMFSKGLISANDYELLRKQTLGIKEMAAVVTDTVAHYDSLMFSKGEADAKDYFRTGNVFGSTLATSALATPVLGLIPAMVFTFTPPAEKNLQYPFPELGANDAYKKGYLKEARKERRASAWKAWAVGVAIDALAGAVTEIVLSTRGKK